MAQGRRGELARRVGGRRRLRWVALAVVGLAATVVLWRRAGEPRWYRLVYQTFYALGLRVWERDVPAADLVALVEGPTALPAGRALDLGCGTATDSIYLARHGWDVTGVDMVPQALAIARRKATAAGVAPRFIRGDVTRLQDLGVGQHYTLLLDFGCFHTLPTDQRDAYVASVTAVAAPGATFLLYGFAKPPRLAPMQAGVTTEEVRQRFAGARWELVGAELVSADAIRVARTRVDRSFALWRYRLRRLPQ